MLKLNIKYYDKTIVAYETKQPTSGMSCSYIYWRVLGVVAEWSKVLTAVPWPLMV